VNVDEDVDEDDAENIIVLESALKIETFIP
jgi:hypothetical protein